MKGMCAPARVVLLLFLAALPLRARDGFIELRDGRKVQGRVRLEPGRVVVVNAAESFAERVAFSNVAAVTFNSASAVARSVLPPGGVDRLRGAADGSMPPGWQSRDIGSVGAPGRVEAMPNYVRLHSGGRNILNESDSFQFVFKQVDGDTELLTRVMGMESADPWARAGLMIREELTPSARGIYLGATTVRGTAVLWRPEPGEAMRAATVRDGAAERAQAFDEAARAMRAAALERAQAVEDIFQAALKRGGGMKEMQEAHRQIRELHRQRAMARPPLVEVNSPEAGREFSTPVWLRLKRRQDTFSTYLSRDGIQWSLVERVSLPMGRTVFAGLAATGFREWVSMNGTQRRPGRATFQEVEEGPFLWSRFVPEVELRSGTVLRGYVGGLDDARLGFAGLPARAPVWAQHVANIRFQAAPVSALKHLRAGVPGVVLRNGDFVEGECRGIAGGRVTISSVPLGLMSYDVDLEVLAVVLRKPAEGRGGFEVRTSDGARWIASRLECGEAELIIDEPLLGRQRLSVAALTEWRCRS